MDEYDEIPTKEDENKAIGCFLLAFVAVLALWVATLFAAYEVVKLIVTNI